MASAAKRHSVCISSTQPMQPAIAACLIGGCCLLSFILFVILLFIQHLSDLGDCNAFGTIRQALFTEDFDRSQFLEVVISFLFHAIKRCSHALYLLTELFVLVLGCDQLCAWEAGCRFRQRLVTPC